MKRSWNWPVWVGFLLVPAGLVSYPLFFARFPVTRDFPWANLAMMALGLVLLGVGIARAFRRPDAYRGKVFGSILGVAGIGVAAFACYGFLVLARQLPIAINLVSHCPKVSFILDHCGVPQVKEKILDPWRAHISEIAKFPNVVCKVSGLVAYANSTNWTAEDLRPYVEHVIGCFGWDRVMFGSDWPVCTLTATYKQWVDALQSITNSAGESSQKKLFHDNAVRIYRLS